METGRDRVESQKVEKRKTEYEDGKGRLEIGKRRSGGAEVEQWKPETGDRRREEIKSKVKKSKSQKVQKLIRAERQGS